MPERGPTRTFVVGDVHGCADELDDLLRTLAFGRGDRLVFVGDLVAKGPDSAGVVDRAREIGALAVVGNHELPVLRYADARRRGEAPTGVREGHASVARSLSDAALRWLENLPFTLPLQEFGVRVVHAGMAPGVALESQALDWLVNMRSLREDGSVSKRVDEGVPWASVYTGPEHLVFGHDAIRGLQRYPHATGLDTGCVYGGRLTALELPGFVLHSVPARKAYVPL